MKGDGSKARFRSARLSCFEFLVGGQLIISSLVGCVSSASKPEPVGEPVPSDGAPEPACTAFLHGRLYDAERSCFDYHDDGASRWACVDERILESCGDDALWSVLTPDSECWQLPFVCNTLPEGWTSARDEECANAPECDEAPEPGSDPEPATPDSGGDPPDTSDSCAAGLAELSGRVFDTARGCFLSGEDARRSQCVAEQALERCGDDVPSPVVAPNGECWQLPFACTAYPEGWSSAEGHPCEHAFDCGAVDEAPASDAG
jgi:hypothetical protein